MLRGRHIQVKIQHRYIWDEFVFKSLQVHEVSMCEDLVDCVGRLLTNCHLSKDWAKNKVENLIKGQCLKIEISLNRSWPWWILPFTNKVELDIIRDLPNTDKQAELLHAMKDVLRAADHTITGTQNYSNISKSSNREFYWYSNTQIAQRTSVARLVLLLAWWLAATFNISST